MIAARSSGRKPASCNARANACAALLKIAIGEPFFFALAIGFDQARLIGKLIERIFERFADGLIIFEIEHYRRD